MRKVYVLFSVLALLGGTLLAAPTITELTARQRYPWNGLVDITVMFSGVSNDLANAECRFVATNSRTQTALSVAHITREGGDSGNGNVWTRRFVWDATADVGEVKIDDVALTVEASWGGVQLWENGPYWAEYNVGATKPEEYGYYFWWGDTVGYKRSANNDGWVSVANGTMFTFSRGNCPTYNRTTSQLQSAGYIDSTGNLVATHDAATVHLGAPWRMPTDAEFSALINKCDTIWTTRNGVYGRLVTGRGAYASRSIFLPAAGYGRDSSLSYPGSLGLYWSSSPSSGNSGNAWGLSFDSGDFYRDYYGSRCIGRSVRPLRGFAY